MNNDIIMIIFVIVLAILFIAIAAYFLQQWLILRQHGSNASTARQESITPEWLYFEEKLTENYGDEIPAPRIKVLLAIPNSLDKIILLDCQSHFQNLLRCHSNGWIVWRGELPIPEDVYTHIEWQGGELKALSGLGYLVTIDLEKGEILDYEFAKEPFKIG